MTVIIDIISTFVEVCGFVYLVKAERIEKTSKYIFVILQTIIGVLFTYVFTVSRIEIKFLLIISSLIILGIFVLRLSIAKSIFYMVIGILMLLSSELIVMLIEMLLKIDISSAPEMLLERTVAMKMIFITLIIIIQKIVSDVSHKRLKAASISFFFLSNIGYSFVAVCINIIIVSFRDVIEPIFLLGCTVAVFVAFVANILFSDRFFSLEEQKQEQMMAIYKLELQSKYYEEKLVEEEKIKQIYHDLKNHLLVLEELNSKDIENISKIRTDISKYENYFRTGNKILDIILKDKFKIAREKNILIEDDINMSEGNFLEALDISTIFGNLLDNAIEANDIIGSSNGKYINIFAGKRKEFIVISIKNSMSIFEGQKKRKIIHGYGLTNVSDAVHKYSGEISVSKQEGEFSVNIIIPIPVVHPAKSV